MSRTVSLLFVLAMFLLPFGWLLGVVDEYGIEQQPSISSAICPPGRALAGAAIGLIAGLMANRGRPLPGRVFLGMVLVAGLSSWGLLYVAVGINSTSGNGIELNWALGTVWSWLLAFAAFFITAWIVQRGFLSRRWPRPDPSA